jgi:hypothetical protein
MAIGHSPQEAALIADTLQYRRDALTYILRVVATTRDDMIRWQPIDTVLDTGEVTILDGHEQLSCLIAHHAAEIVACRTASNGRAMVAALTAWSSVGLDVVTERLCRRGLVVVSSAASSPAAHLSGDLDDMLIALPSPQTSQLFAPECGSGTDQSHPAIGAHLATSRKALGHIAAHERKVIVLSAVSTRSPPLMLSAGGLDHQRARPLELRPVECHSVSDPIYDALVEVCGPSLKSPAQHASANPPSSNATGQTRERAGSR